MFRKSDKKATSAFKITNYDVLNKCAIAEEEEER
jgi:hypothetical protein